MSRPADPHAKEALLAAARAEFAKKGLRGARVEDITAACGLSKGAFYLHFESKDALFQLLVDAFMAEMAACSQHRLEDMQSILERQGPLTADDFRGGSARAQEWWQAQTGHDLETLEAMWKYRDVMDVLLTGVQGTPFEKTLWDIVDLETARIAEDHRRFQGAGCLRADAPPEFIAAMIIGTYLLVGKQMARMAEKPDLALWARTLQALMHEGLVPRDQTPRDSAPLVESAAQHVRTHAKRTGGQKLKAKHPRPAAVRSDR